MLMLVHKIEISIEVCHFCDLYFEEIKRKEKIISKIGNVQQTLLLISLHVTWFCVVHWKKKPIDIRMRVNSDFLWLSGTS